LSVKEIYALPLAFMSLDEQGQFSRKESSRKKSLLYGSASNIFSAVFVEMRLTVPLKKLVAILS